MRVTAASDGAALAPINPTDTATAPTRTAILRTIFFMCPHLGLRAGPTEWPDPDSVSARAANREPESASQNCIAETCSSMVVDQAISEARPHVGARVALPS